MNLYKNVQSNLFALAFEKIDRHEQELFELKRAEPRLAEPHTSTPGPLNQNKRRPFFHKDQQTFLDKRRLPIFNAVRTNFRR